MSNKTNSKVRMWKIKYGSLFFSSVHFQPTIQYRLTLWWEKCVFLNFIYFCLMVVFWATRFFVLIFLIFYIWLVRPNQKGNRAHRKCKSACISVNFARSPSMPAWSALTQIRGTRPQFCGFQNNTELKMTLQHNARLASKRYKRVSFRSKKIDEIVWFSAQQDIKPPISGGKFVLKQYIFRLMLVSNFTDQTK